MFVIAWHLGNCRLQITYSIKEEGKGGRAKKCLMECFLLFFTKENDGNLLKTV